MADATISLLPLLIITGLTFVLVRWCMSPSNSNQNSGSRRGGQRVNIAAIESVAAMFPQLDRRAIAWDLQRNGGNAQASVERMLTRGSLDVPPPSFQPQGLNPPQAAGSPQVSGASKTAASRHQDLITRFKLTEKLKAQEAEDEQRQGEKEQGRASGKSSGWSTNKGERAAMLQSRREKMILEARRKMEEKDRRDLKGKGKEMVE